MTDVSAAANPSNLPSVTGPVEDMGVGVKLLQPNNQAAYVAPPASTAATNTSPYGFTTSAQADALVACVRAMSAAMIAAGLMKAS